MTKRAKKHKRVHQTSTEPTSGNQGSHSKTTKTTRESNKSLQRSESLQRNRANDLAKKNLATTLNQDIGQPNWSGINHKARRLAERSLAFHCKYYHADTFSLPFAGYHNRLIELSERVVHQGGWFAFAVPRGGGKSKIAECVVEWATLHGHKVWPVLIGATGPAALERLTNIKVQLQNNRLLLRDFPEVCYPISQLGRSARKAEGQHIDGLNTAIQWKQDWIALPIVERPPGWQYRDNQGSRISAFGLTAAFRGMSATTERLKTIRPDLAIPDDPQTRESARSLSQTADRIATVMGDVAYLGGPGQKMSILLPCTVINRNDLADQLLDTATNPQFHGERHKMLESMPENLLKWDEYAEVRRGIQASKSKSFDELNAFYLANREELDKGAVATWPERFNDDEVSAIQHAMNRKIDDEASFMAECQNEPVVDQDVDTIICPPKEIIVKQHHLPRRKAPLYVEKVVAHVDVQHEFNWWGVAGASKQFETAILDYGTYPDQKRHYFTKRDSLIGWSQVFDGNDFSRLEARIFAGLIATFDMLRNLEIEREDGVMLEVGRIHVDKGDMSEVVEQACRESAHSSIIMPVKGVGVGAKSQPWEERKRAKGESKGLGWWTKPIPHNKAQQFTLVNANYWKTQLHLGFRAGQGAAGSVSLFKETPERHRMFADHCNNESVKKVKADDNEVFEWIERPHKPDEDYFDIGYNLLAALAMAGCELPGTDKARDYQQRRKVKRWSNADYRR